MSDGERPILWARLSVNHTKKTCCVALVLPLICVAIIAVFKLLKLSDQSDYDYLIKNDVRTQLLQARVAAKDEFAFTTNEDAERTRRNEGRTFIMLFRNTIPGGKPGKYKPEKVDIKTPGTNLLTPEALSFLKKAEDAVENSADFQRFCFRDLNNLKNCEGRTCALVDSITSHPQLYGEENENGTICNRKKGSEPVSNEQFERFKNSVRNASLPVIRYMGTDFNATSFSTQILRSFVPFGSPIGDAKGATTDDEKDQAFSDWAVKVSDTVFGQNTNKFHIYLLSNVLADAEFEPLIFRDLSFAGISVILVFVAIWVHTTSSYLAATAMLQILLSFPLTFLVYRGVFQITYFAALQVMTIFLILGIGADDVFVFTDAWKQAPVTLGKDASLVDRMTWTYRRAVKAMSVTSFTTAVAFFTTAVSPIMPIATLGIWAGLLVLLQFVLVITIYPSALVIWQRFWRLHRWYRCFRRSPMDEAMDNGDLEQPAPVTEGDSGVSLFDNANNPELPGAARPHSVLSRANGLFGKKRNEGEYRLIERFFNGPWTNWMRVARFPLIVVGAILVGLSIWLATRLETPTDPETFIPDSHPTQQAFGLIDTAFPAADSSNNIEVAVVFGIKGINRKGTSKYNPEEIGKAVLDDKFSLLTKEAQMSLLEVCNEFEKKETGLTTTEATIDEKVNCWIRDFERYRETKNKMNFETYENDTMLIKDILEFGNAVDEGRKPYLGYLKSGRIAFNKDETKVMFTEVSFVSKVKSSSPYAVTWPMYNEWQDALNRFKKTSTVPGMESPVTIAGPWSWMMSQKAIVDNMFLGIGVVLAVSIVSLSVSTGNWIVALLALVCIGGILCNLLGLIYLFGWKLGIIESIGVVIAVGFSFDYVAHVANAYTESESESNTERTRDALTDLGISVLAGAVSTLLAGSMLFFAVIVFFVKFGVFVVVTIALSLVWGLVFFPSLLHAMGPAGKTGRLSVIFSPLVRCFRRNNDREASDHAVETPEPRDETTDDSYRPQAM